MTTFSALFGGSAGAGPYSVPSRGYRSGYYYNVPNVIEGATLSAFALTAGRIYYTPFYVHADITISAITFSNSSASSGHKLRSGIYSNDGGSPGTLIVAGPEITLDAATSTVREVAVSTALTKGWYWFALQSDSATSIYTAAGGSDIGWSLNGASSPVGPGFSGLPRNVATSTYGALPSTAVTPTLNFNTTICGIKVA